MERLPGSGCRDLRKRGEVGLIRCLPVKARMRSAGVVKAEVPGERTPRLGDCVVGPQVYFFIFDGSPESLHEHIVAPCAPAVHADGDGVAGQQAGECGTGELATLISVEDLRFAMTGQRLGWTLRVCSQTGRAGRCWPGGYFEVNGG